MTGIVKFAILWLVCTFTRAWRLKGRVMECFSVLLGDMLFVRHNNEMGKLR